MKNPKVSIIIPVYNGSNYLKEAIESALAQTYKNKEILVINDGSIDNGETDKIAKSFGDKIHYFKKRNGGVATAINLGIEKMTGEYFSWLSHDDLYSPNKIEEEVKLIKRSSAKTIIYSDIEIIDGKGYQIGQTHLKPLGKIKFPLALIRNNFIHGCTLLIPKSAFSEAGLFRKELKHTQDYDLWFRMYLKGFRFRLCQKALVKGRRHLDQDSVRKSDQALAEKDELYFNQLCQFGPKEFFFPGEKISLGYLDLAFLFKVLGLTRAAMLAHELSRRNFSKNDCVPWLLKEFRYLLWHELFSQGVKLFIQLVRRFKRKIRSYSKSDLQTSRVVKSDRIRLCLIGNINSPHNHKFLTFLKKERYELFFISTRFGSYPDVKVFSVVKAHFEPMLFWFIRLIWTSRRIIHKIKPDIVQGQSITPGGIAAYLSGFRPYVASVWGSDVFGFKYYNPVIKKLIIKTLQNAKIIIGSSIALKKAIEEISDKTYKFYLIRFGVDAGIFKRQESSLRKKLGLEKFKVIFSPRSIGSIYNTLILVKAFERLSANKKLKLALVDLPSDPLYYQRVKNYIHSHDLEDRVIFLPPVKNTKMVDYYNLADVVVSVTKWDGCSVSVLEAMATESKIVVANLPYLKELRQGQNFWVAQVKIDELSKSIKSALSMPDIEFRSVGLANRRLIEEKANLKDCFNKLREIYKQVLE